MARWQIAVAGLALFALSLGVVACTPASTSPNTKVPAGVRGSGKFTNDVWGLKFTYPPEWGEFQLGLVANNGVQPVLFGVFTNNPEITYVTTNTLRSAEGRGYVNRNGNFYALAVDDSEIEIPRTQVLREVIARNTRILLFKEKSISDKHTGLVDGQGTWSRAAIFHMLSLNRNTLQQFEDMLKSVEVSEVKVDTQ